MQTSFKNCIKLLRVPNCPEVSSALRSLSHICPSFVQRILTIKYSLSEHLFHSSELSITGYGFLRTLLEAIVGKLTYPPEVELARRGNNSALPAAGESEGTSHGQRYPRNSLRHGRYLSDSSFSKGQMKAFLDWQQWVPVQYRAVEKVKYGLD